MASWQTPIIDWDGITTGKKYYNYTDLDRVEQDTEYLDDEFTLLGYVASTTTYTYPRTNKSEDYYDDLNRIENNILSIKNATWEPLTWTTPQTNWQSVKQSFSFTDTNRMESNLLYLYNMLNDLKQGLLKCGDSLNICGKNNYLFG